MLLTFLNIALCDKSVFMRKYDNPPIELGTSGTSVTRTSRLFNLIDKSSFDAAVRFLESKSFSDPTSILNKIKVSKSGMKEVNVFTMGLEDESKAAQR